MAITGCDDEPSVSGRLAARVRRVLHGDGRETRHATIRCPHAQRSRPLDACSACERCVEVTTDPDLTVVCAEPSAAVEAAFVVAATSIRRASRQDGGSAGAACRNDDDLLPRDHEARLIPIAVLLGPEVVCVRDDVAITSLLALFVTHEISGVPVVDEAGRPIGIISKTDLVRDAYERGDTEEVASSRGRLGAPPELGEGFHTIASNRTVRDLMTPLALSLPEGASIAQAAALMAFEGVHRLPVVSETHEVVGLVSSLDILRWLATRSGFVIPKQRRSA